MKRIILVLAVALLLAGCAQPAKQTEDKTPIIPSAIHIAYMPNSSLEQETEGAFRFFAVSKEVERIEMQDLGLVLIDSAGQIAVVSEEDSSVLSSSDAQLAVLSVQNDSVVTYDVESRTVIVLDEGLNEFSKYTLEEGVAGLPVASAQDVYYCVGDHVRALNFESGLSRNVMQYVPGELFLTGVYLNGEIIGLGDGGKVTYLSSKDGQVLFDGEQLIDFESGFGNYFVLYQDGNVQQYIWGNIDGGPMQIVDLVDHTMYPQMQSNCLITTKTEENSVVLSRYDMDSGMCTARVTVKLPEQIVDFAVNQKYTWFLTEEGLYRWEHGLNEYEDANSCITPLINAQNPDTAAIEERANRALEIGQRYGVDIHIWQDALLNDESYVVEAEYQIESIDQMLNDVEKQLALIPDQLLKITDEYCGVQICLVRSIQGHEFVQYRSEKGLCIAVTSAANMEEALLTGLGWGVDSCIIGNSRDLDYWNELNPAGFDYDYSYFVNEHRTDLQYLEGEYRAFVDKRSMSFPSEDRARIFYYAMTQGNAELFESAVLQAKLKTLCEGIREAYGWQKETQIFPWELYLEQSLAYNY